LDELAEVVDYLNLAAFVGVALAAVAQWRRRRDRASLWALLAFLALAAVVVISRPLPERSDELWVDVVERLDLAVLVLFPYLLYRFTTAFRDTRRWVDLALSSLTVVMVVWTFVLPTIPEEGEPRPASFVVYIVAFLAHWATLSVVSAARLWRAGTGQSTIARRRMRLLAAASATLTMAVVVAAIGSDSAAVSVATGLLALASAAGFYLGLAPPRAVRAAWQRPEQLQLRDAIGKLVTLARTRDQILERVLRPMGEIVGARGVTLRDPDGEEIGSWEAEEGALPAVDGAESVTLEIDGGSLEVRTTRYAPFFGEEELALLRSLGSLTMLALDRVRLFQQESEARTALERADELKTNFIALAAHELRTPVTAIHGLAQTLHRRGVELDQDQRTELVRALEGQTTRMTSLVEQLLDLSRLDAEAVEIVPQRFSVRDRLEELTRGLGADHVDIAVAKSLEVNADPTAFERIVGNLIANATRYGEPPIVVSASQNDRHFRLSVEDHGGGVPPEFVPELFERFRRSPRSRERATGTGLGLAIARSFARAHGGDLLYEPAEPSGARFQLVLPVGRN
jgi:signal transduction histidine kinase